MLFLTFLSIGKKQNYSDKFIRFNFVDQEELRKLIDYLNLAVVETDMRKFVKITDYDTLETDKFGHFQHEFLPELSKDEIAAAKRKLIFFKSKEEQLKLIIHYYQRAKKQYISIEESVLSTATCFEIMFTKSSQEPITEKLVSRICCLLKRDVTDLVKLFYDVRSKYIHTGRIPDGKNSYTRKKNNEVENKRAVVEGRGKISTEPVRQRGGRGRKHRAMY